MAEEPIRVGIAGLGRSGWNIHAEGLAQIDRYRVTAVADPMAERRDEAAERFGCATYADPAKVTEHPGVDVVVVATPSHTHASLTVNALESGKHVVVEKPMAQSAAEVDDMVAAAEKAGRVVTCFQNSRLDPTFLAIRDVIDSGSIGEIVLIHRNLHRFARRADWQTLRKFGGGELSNTASHYLDQTLLLMDDGPLEVFADLRRTVSVGDAEDHVKLCLRAKTGPTVDIESSAVVATPQPLWWVAGTAGGIVSTEGGLIVRRFEPEALGSLEVDDGPATGRRYGTGEQIEWQEETIAVGPPGHQPTITYYEKLAETLRHGAELFVTPETVRRQIDVIERARHQTGML